MEKGKLIIRKVCSECDILKNSENFQVVVKETSNGYKCKKVCPSCFFKLNTVPDKV